MSSGLGEDLVHAVWAEFSAKEADEVVALLSSVDSDRVACAILVSATVLGPDITKIRTGVEASFVDWRDVLMTEYDPRVDYKGALERLGLDRPYPV